MTGKLNPRFVAVSLAAVSAVASLACAALIAIAPKATTRFFGSIFHGLDISKIAAPITLSGTLTGLVAIIITALVSGWLFATFYNIMAGRAK